MRREETPLRLFTSSERRTFGGEFAGITNVPLNVPLNDDAAGLKSRIAAADDS
jgi:hypothetical protein